MTEPDRLLVTLRQAIVDVDAALRDTPQLSAPLPSPSVPEALERWKARRLVYSRAKEANERAIGDDRGQRALMELCDDALRDIAAVTAEAQQELIAQLADANQQLKVLRPGGTYAWKCRAEASEAQLADLDQRHENLRMNEARIREHYLARLAQTEAQLTEARAEIARLRDALLDEIQERITATFTPQLNDGTALEALMLVGGVLRDMRAEAAPPATGHAETT